MFGLERHQQDEDPAWRSVTTFRCLKDRYTGMATGAVMALLYTQETGLLSVGEFPPKKGKAERAFEDDGEF